ncbi:MAG: hypothetical protein OEX02_16230 [Cyclobacteriaceae bacterium]|nr:hypothetical protein [Cyclobacteriaceae bacterium]
MDKQETWFTHIRDCAQSGQAQKAYCQEHGLKYSTFGYWRKRYLQDQSEESTESTGRFIPLDIQDQGYMEVNYPNGVRLQVPSGIAINQLSSLIRLY